MSLVETVAASTELISVDVAKRHLRIMSDDLDTEVDRALSSARALCESTSGRTLRPATTRVWSLSSWLCNGSQLQLPYPPLITIDSVKYYDANDGDITVDESLYSAVLSTNGPGFLVFDDDFTAPALSDRPDAVRI
jgi:hypothetical protein